MSGAAAFCRLDDSRKVCANIAHRFSQAWYCGLWQIAFAGLRTLFNFIRYQHKQVRVIARNRNGFGLP
jgi:hypothetical protein